ncbi:GerMN domain-containing protein [Ferdinandcohnia quinoae]|uniref:GerMN domain-containing protein n=1 Tax=Fredinandcohnia quinoae TaxID=2918902 RepID=A0AAW5E9E5_9BACI|nr:GerMN domain-containing protein [Fredinandcohnia sp. SECRCQ15]MCH1627604.1 GerMN domain-containing protein [Fredinandcohnia sp. SECRCQ15]
MRKVTKSTLAATVIASSVLLSGCGLFSVEKKVDKIDPPQDVTMDKSTDKEAQEVSKNTDGKDAVTDTVKRDLFLIDENGWVVPQTVELPNDPAAARQVLEYLVAGGPVDEILPDGFRAVIPQDTEVDVKLEGSTLVVDFSKEFGTYEPEDEAKILQAITWTLTQFDTIENVELQVNGYKLDAMPVNQTPISESLSRADGINLDNSDVVDITNTRQVTLYFYVENNDSKYYVPITKRIDNSEKDNIAAVVNALIKGPKLTSNLLNGIHPDAELLGATYKDGLVTLDFNEAIFGSFDEKVVSKHVINSLVLSLTEQPGIESVAITVDGNADITSEDGKKLSEPVTRPVNVNIGSF